MNADGQLSQFKALTTPEELGTRIAEESERYGKLIKLIKISLD